MNDEVMDLMMDDLIGYSKVTIPGYVDVNRIVDEILTPFRSLVIRFDEDAQVEVLEVYIGYYPIGETLISGEKVKCLFVGIDSEVKPVFEQYMKTGKYK